MKKVGDVRVTIIFQGDMSVEEFEERIASAVNNGWEIKGMAAIATTFASPELSVILVSKTVSGEQRNE